uniref:NADH dehydrogenase [ubiquinone] 1 alpha subcomplex subunit 3 n=1 Tax=Canis lupus familiaris TaxID=9615 RepID=A0A8C0REP3_CANLF
MAERHAAFLKDAWAKEPVLVESFTIGGLAVILPIVSPFTKYATMNNQATPYNYPVTLRDDGTFNKMHRVTPTHQKKKPKL